MGSRPGAGRGCHVPSTLVKAGQGCSTTLLCQQRLCPCLWWHRWAQRGELRVMQATGTEAARAREGRASLPLCPGHVKDRGASALSQIYMADILN